MSWHEISPYDFVCFLFVFFFSREIQEAGRTWHTRKKKKKEKRRRKRKRGAGAGAGRKEEEEPYPLFNQEVEEKERKEGRGGGGGGGGGGGRKKREKNEMKWNVLIGQKKIPIGSEPSLQNRNPPSLAGIVWNRGLLSVVRLEDFGFGLVWGLESLTLSSFLPCSTLCVFRRWSRFQVIDSDIF